MDVTGFPTSRLIGAAVVGAGLALMGWSVFNFAQIGSCETPGPNPCPPGFVFMILGFIAAIWLLVLGAMLGGRHGGGGFGIASATAGCLTVGAALLAARSEPSGDLTPSEASGLLIAGLVALAVGLAGFAGWLYGRIRAT